MTKDELRDDIAGALADYSDELLEEAAARLIIEPHDPWNQPAADVHGAVLRHLIQEELTRRAAVRAKGGRP